MECITFKRSPEDSRMSSAPALNEMTNFVSNRPHILNWRQGVR